MAYIAKVDRDLCIGSGECVRLAPKTFQLDSESKSTVIAQGADSDEVLMEAAKTCPVAAIILTDPSGNQVYPK